MNEWMNEWMKNELPSKTNHPEFNSPKPYLRHYDYGYVECLQRRDNMQRGESSHESDHDGWIADAEAQSRNRGNLEEKRQKSNAGSLHSQEKTLTPCTESDGGERE